METLRIDGYIANDEMATHFGSLSNFSLQHLNNFLDNIPAGTRDLKVEINSGGGSVTEGFAIYDRLVSSRINIHTEVLGLCGSIATIIALSAPAGNRSMHSNSEYFIHNPAWRPSSPDPMEAKDLEKLAIELKSDEQKIIDFYAEKTGQSAAKIREFMDDGKSLSAEQAKQLGFITNIIGESITAEKKYLIAAFVEPKKPSKNIEMDANQKTFLDKLDSMISKFNAKFNAILTPVFMMFIDLDNGGKIFVDTQDEKVLKGMKAFNVDAEGKKTVDPAPDGEYLMKDGRTLVIAAGTVTDVKDKQPDETTALKAQIAELTAKLETASNEKKVVETEKTVMQASFVAMKKEFEDIKKMVLTTDIPGAEQTFKGQSEATKSANQAWLDYKKAKQEKELKAKKS